MLLIEFPFKFSFSLLKWFSLNFDSNSFYLSWHLIFYHVKIKNMRIWQWFWREIVVIIHVILQFGVTQINFIIPNCEEKKRKLVIFLLKNFVSSIFLSTLGFCFCFCFQIFNLRACFTNSSKSSSRSLFLGIFPTNNRWLLNDIVTPIFLPFRISKSLSCNRIWFLVCVLILKTFFFFI